MAQTKIKKVSATTQFEDEEQKKKALDTAIGQITKNFGQGSIIKIRRKPFYKCQCYFYRIANT